MPFLILSFEYQKQYCFWKEQAEVLKQVTSEGKHMSKREGHHFKAYGSSKQIKAQESDYKAVCLRRKKSEGEILGLLKLQEFASPRCLIFHEPLSEDYKM